MNSNELRQKFLKFFEVRDHKIVPSASLIPKDDPSVLFTTAGMQQFKSFYTNPENAPAKNVVSIQKSLRTSDIDEIGDDTHLTFFEMLGNFSFDGYWKKEAIKYALEFLENDLGVDHSRISTTYFEGDDKLALPADLVSKAELQNYFEAGRISGQGSLDNFWGPTGDEGPCGPTVEFYIDSIEVWNLVFNEFYKNKEGKLIPSETRGIDTGMGLERLSMLIHNKHSVFETDLLEPILHSVTQIQGDKPLKAIRIIADHLRAVVFIIADGVLPGKDERNYIPRLLIRNAMSADYLYISAGLDKDFFRAPVDVIIQTYSAAYPYLTSNRKEILSVIEDEVEKFSKTLTETIKDLKKIYNKFISIDPEASEGMIIKDNLIDLDGKILFKIRETHGVGLPIMKMVMEKWGLKFSEKTNQQYEKAYRAAQELSRTASAGQFKGGLASHSDKIVRLHTATHLLNAALRKVLGNDVWQKGSNITEERTRFDFTHNGKMSDEQKQEVEKLVNNWIALDLMVKKDILPLEEAKKLGAIGVFGEKYPDTVSIYTIYDSDTNEIISREFCGGPHVDHTGLIGQFKIKKEEAVSAGVRRIKAEIE